jgi:hypothetical protein
MDLWQAQRVLQSAPPRWTCRGATLSRALNAAAGEAAVCCPGRTAADRPHDAEYLRYYTPTDRPTGEWAAAIKRLREADDEVARCTAAVAEVDDAVGMRH